MLDAAVIQGGAAAVGGLAVGLGMAWFSEQQVEQGEQRGSDAVSEATRAKMSAMFMEDEVLPDTTLDDTVLRMEAALAAAKGEAAAEEKVEEKPNKGKAGPTATALKGSQYSELPSAAQHATQPSQQTKPLLLYLDLEAQIVCKQLSPFLLLPPRLAPPAASPFCSGPLPLVLLHHRHGEPAPSPW